MTKDGSCYVVNDINLSKLYPVQAPRDQGQCKYDAYSLWCKQDLKLREEMDSNIPDICALACPVTMHSAFIPKSRNFQTCSLL